MKLVHGPWEAVLAPACGGGIAALRRGGADILRPSAKGAEETDPLALACFPMAPWVNRIADGRFTFDGTAVALPGEQIAGQPHALHGEAWQAPWAVLGTTPNSATLLFEGGSGAFPFPYRVTQTLALHDDDARLALVLENIGDRAMPAAIGLHPFFDGLEDVLIEAEAAHVWLTREDLIPTERMVVPEAWWFREPTALAGLGLDHAFDGWPGRVRLTWPGRGIALDLVSPEARFLQIYAPLKGRTFCVEPQTAVPDAVNRAEPASVTGLRILQPGQSLTLTMTLAPAAR